MCALSNLRRPPKLLSFASAAASVSTFATYSTVAANSNICNSVLQFVEAVAGPEGLKVRIKSNSYPKCVSVP